MPERVTGDRQKVRPTSFAQERLWLLDRLDPGSPAYNIARAIRVRGALSSEALRASLEAVVARHESLRTTFAEIDDRPVQVIAFERPFELPTVDLGDLPDPKREAYALRLAREEAQTPFDLVNGPLVRAKLWRLRVDEHILVLVMHHIIADVRSMAVLLGEIGRFYEPFTLGHPAVLPDPPIQHGDFARWQRESATGERVDEHLDYWRRHLAGTDPVLELPADRTRPAVRTADGATARVTFSSVLRERLTALSHDANATLFMTLLAAFHVLLWRYTDRDDLVIGSPAPGRSDVEQEHLIGLFANTLVIRTDLSGNPTFRELLERVREVVLDAYAHQDAPFERVIEALHVPRSLSYAPLVQVMFTLQTAPTQRVDLTGLTLEELEFDNGSARFDLTVEMAEVDGGLSCGFEYSTDLLDHATVARMLGHYQTLLESIVADPGERLSELRLMGAAEQQRLLVEWNDTAADYPRDRCLHWLFEAQVERTPAAVALVYRDRCVTYRELNARANQLARYLRRRGVARGMLVGICVERSIEAVVGLLGILKAGCAYVPLDPAYPRERLAYMMADSRAPVLLTVERLVTAVPTGANVVIRLDADWDSISHEDDTNPDSGVTAEDLAYVTYTSGSTGMPKGVQASHRGPVNRLAWMWNTWKFEPGEVCCQKASLGFVVSVWEVFGPMLQGIRNVIIPDEELKDPDRMVQTLAANRVSRIGLVPSMLGHLLDHVPDLRRRVPDLKLVYTSGEALTVELTRRFAETLPTTTLLNMYGLSEVASGVSSYVVSGRALSRVPAGRPIANTQIYVLDRYLNPVPIGVPGEIHIGGDGVAQGYLHNPELTSQKFIADPFARRSDARLYKTGDVGRFLPDGNLVFLARVDQQVKVRGYRIEPAEIEAVLRQHPGVRESAVVAREDRPGDPHLVAYLVLAQPAPTINDLRGFLRERLPNPMIPAQFVTLEALPLSPNGKIDRLKLPAPSDGRADNHAGYVKPGIPLEEQLVQIWEEFLDVRPIGIRDNFLDLGGHSLLAVRITSAIERTVGRTLPPSALLGGATIEQLAEVLVAQQAEALSSPVTAIHATGAKAPFFFLHGDFEGGGFYCLNLARALGEDQPFYALHPHGLDGRPVPQSIEAMASEHLATVQTLQPHGPYLLGGHCNGGLIAFEIAQRLAAEGERVEFLALMDVPAENTWFGAGLLERLMKWSAVIGTRPAQERLARCVRLRREIRKWVTHYRRRLPQLLRSHPDERGAAFRRKARRMKELLLGATSPRRTSAAGLDRVSTRPLKPLRPGAMSLGETYRRVMDGYVPHRYAGRITVFRAQDTFEDPVDLEWRAVAREVDVHVIPGGHLTFITRHVRVLGEHLRACLQNGDGT